MAPSAITSQFARADAVCCLPTIGPNLRSSSDCATERFLETGTQGTKSIAATRITLNGSHVDHTNTPRSEYRFTVAVLGEGDER